MNKAKEKQLNNTYYNFMQIGLGNAPLEIIDEVIDKNITGYGTTIDEKILTARCFKNLIKRQREQSEDSKINIEFGSPEKRINRIVRFGFAPVLIKIRAASIAAATPAPLSAAPVPASSESMWAPTITYSSGVSEPGISATTL